jgi:hypothetical protein
MTDDVLCDYTQHVKAKVVLIADEIHGEEKGARDET